MKLLEAKSAYNIAIQHNNEDAMNQVMSKIRDACERGKLWINLIPNSSYTTIKYVAETLSTLGYKVKIEKRNCIGSCKEIITMKIYWDYND